MEPIIKTILTFATGGAVWEGVKFLYPEIKRYFESKRLATNAFYKNLDPILKSASELYGKLESLAKEDFSTFIDPENSNSIDIDQNRKYVYYLFSQFWAQLEYLRLESQYTAISKIEKGNQLLRFIETFESRKFRILDRSMQRIIGECLITQKDQKFRVITLNEFIIQFEESSSNLHGRIANLESTLLSVKNKEIRQKILKFGVLVAALIDHFDPKYKTARKRSVYINKLSEKSKKSIKTLLVEHYLPFLKNKDRYYKNKPAGIRPRRSLTIGFFS